MMKLYVAFNDGTVVEEDILNEEVSDVEIRVQETNQDLICRVEIEDSKQKITCIYRKETTYVY